MRCGSHHLATAAQMDAAIHSLSNAELADMQAEARMKKETRIALMKRQLRILDWLIALGTSLHELDERIRLLER